MAEFYGSIQGARGKATRLGGKASGLTAVAASWEGAVETRLYVNDRGETIASVEFVPWHGQGVRATLYHGPVNDPAKDIGACIYCGKNAQVKRS